MAETITWVDAAGDAWPLTGGSFGCEVLLGPAGRGSPGASLTVDAIPERAGGVLRAQVDQVRDVDLPVLFTASTATALRTVLRDWAFRLHAGRGEGSLRVVAPGGDGREIAAVCPSGIQWIEDAAANPTGLWQKALLTFTCVDVYWTDLFDTTLTYTTGTPASFFPVPNAGSGSFITINAGAVVASPTVDTSPAQVDCWPVWTITGPVSGTVQLRNTTSGKQLRFDTTIAAGDTVTVDSRPNVKTVVLSDGSNGFSLLTSDSAMWPLAVGSNTLILGADGASTATSIVLAFRRRYLTA